MASAADLALAGAPKTSLRPTPRGGAGFIAPKASVSSAASLIKAAGLGGHTAFVVADARTGQVLESKGANLKMPPASVTKTITTLYALNALGGGYRFKTRLMATGPVKNGRLKGDLVLVGGGDPTLDTDALGDMAKQLKQAGVREVTGKFRVNGSALPYVRSIDPSQPDHLGYNPSINGLNLNFNRVHFEWKRAANGYQITMDARAKRYRPTVSIAKMRVVNRDLPVYTYKSAGGRDSWTVARSALGKGGSRWLPVRKPNMYAGEVFRSLARSYGIRLPAPKEISGPAKGTVLVQHQSDILTEVLRGLLKYSNNLTAETVGLTASAARGGSGGSLRASAKKMTAWEVENLNGKNSNFVDHSGLEPATRLTASDMVAALVKDGPNGQLSKILKKIPLRDSKGKEIKNHPVTVVAKTGTLNFVSALAGFVKAPDGTILAFAIFSADEKHRARVAKKDREAPIGRKRYNKHAKRLQQQLIERWVSVYSG